MRKLFSSYCGTSRALAIAIGLIGLSTVSCAQEDLDTTAIETQKDSPAESSSVETSSAELGTLELRANGEDFVEQAAPVLIKAVEAPVGQYNARSWTLSAAASGPAAGSALLLVGTAVEGEETLPFTIGLAVEQAYACGDSVGDVHKGILDAGDRAEVEAPFHFDHIFGNGEVAADDPINTDAVGRLGHRGEGHCALRPT